MPTLTATNMAAVAAYQARGLPLPTSRRAPATAADASVNTAMPTAAVSSIVITADSRRGSL